MCAFVHYSVLDSGVAIEDDGTSASLDVVDGGLEDGEADGGAAEDWDEAGEEVRCCHGEELLEWTAVGGEVEMALMELALLEEVVAYF